MLLFISMVGGLVLNYRMSWARFPCIMIVELIHIDRLILIGNTEVLLFCKYAFYIEKYKVDVPLWALHQRESDKDANYIYKIIITVRCPLLNFMRNFNHCFQKQKDLFDNH